MPVKEIIYFDEPGPHNSVELLKLGIKRTDELGIKTVVMASQAGVTTKQFLELTKDNRRHEIIAVTSEKGALGLLVTTIYSKYEKSRKIREDYEKRGITHFRVTIDEETRQELEKEGVKVLYLEDVLSVGDPWGLDGEGLNKVDREWKRRRDKLAPFIPAHLRPLDIEAGMDLSPFNIISMGFRVAIGVTVASVRYGLVKQGELVFATAGTGFAGGGTDTGIIIEARANPRACWVREIIGFPVQK